MLNFGTIIRTPEQDLSCILDIKTIKVNSDQLEFNEKRIQLRFPNLELANKQLEIEWFWHIRGEIENYILRCRQVWDEITCGDAPVMRKPEIDKSFDLLDRYLKFLYTDMGFYMSNTCKYFKTVLLHFQYVLPPDHHQWHHDLQNVLVSLSDLFDLMEEHIDTGKSLSPISETEQN